MNPVVSVRALALADELRRSKTLAFVASLNPANSAARISPFWLDGPELDFAAQRLASVCERELGIRGRHYDRKEIE